MEAVYLFVVDLLFKHKELGIYSAPHSFHCGFAFSYKIVFKYVLVYGVNWP